jgi:hypothetical protein
LRGEIYPQLFSNRWIKPRGNAKRPVRCNQSLATFTCFFLTTKFSSQHQNQPHPLRRTFRAQGQNLPEVRQLHRDPSAGQGAVPLRQPVQRRRPPRRRDQPSDERQLGRGFHRRQRGLREELRTDLQGPGQQGLHQGTPQRHLLGVGDCPSIVVPKIDNPSRDRLYIFII